MEELLLLSGRTLQYFIPGLFSMLFRIYGMGVKSKQHATIGLTVFCLLALGIPLTLIPILGYDIYRQITFPVTFLCNLCAFIVTTDNPIKTFFIFFTQANVVFWVGMVASSLRRMFALSYVGGNIIRLILCGAMLYIALRFWAKPLRFMVDTIRSGWVGLLAIPICNYLSVTVISVYFGLLPSYPEGILIATMTALIGGFLFYMQGLYHSLQESRQLEQERSRQALLHAQMRAMDDAVQATKRNRHDLHHHNAILLDYLTTQKIAEAVTYLEGMNQELDATAFKQWCRNPTANAVFRVYDEKTRALGIAFRVRADIPTTLPISEPQLAALLSNLLENAVESCKKLPQGAGIILFSAQTTPSGWQLELRNSVVGRVEFLGELPRSTKQSGGIGTRSVATIVENCNGILRFRQEGKAFVSQVFLPL